MVCYTRLCAYGNLPVDGIANDKYADGGVGTYSKVSFAAEGMMKQCSGVCHLRHVLL